jgi:hypothetical protein
LSSESDDSPSEPVDPVEPDAPEAVTGFERDVLIDKPGIVGARWWHKSLLAQDAAVRRRAILKGVAVAGGVLGAITLVGYGIVKAVEAIDSDVQLRDSIAMQRLYGWDFGARGEALVFDGVEQTPFVKDDLKKLASILKPTRFTAFHVTTLLESLEAKPDSTPQKQRVDVDSQPAKTAPFKALIDVITPHSTIEMAKAYLAGEALARLSSHLSPMSAVLVDMHGPLAAAFAAGACSVFEPVLLFDNWPHPHGVVASHLVLAALAYYQPRFAKQTPLRSSTDVMPLFLIDHDRTTAYSEDSDRFDNRYFARMPTAAALSKLGVKHLFYVVATPSSLPEPDDLNIVLSSMRPTVDARALAANEFDGPSPKLPSSSAPTGNATSDADAFHYGGSPDTDGSLWVNYPFVTLPFASASSSTPARIASSTTKDYVFTRRAAAQSTPSSDFGKVAVALAGGVVIGAILRRGSMNRSSGGWGG